MQLDPKILKGPRLAPRLGFGLEYLGQVAVSFPIVSTILVLVLTVAGLAGMTQMKFNEDLSAALDNTSPRFVDFRQFEQDYSVSDNDLFLVLSAPTFADIDTLTAFQDTVREAGSLDGVIGISSIFWLREATADAQQGDRILSDEVTGDSLNAALVKVARHPLNQNKYLSADQKTAVIILNLEAELSVDMGYRQVLTDIDEILKPVAADGGIELRVTGNPALRVTVIDFLLQDQYLNNGAGVLIGFLISLLMLRSLAASLHNLAAPVAALIWVTGGMGLFGVSITAITVILPVLILVLAFSDSMHMTFDWRERLARGEAWDSALRRSIDTVGPACALTSVTTTLAFLSMTISDAQPIFEFGVAGAFATMTAYVAVIVVNPLISYWRGRLSKPGPVRPAKTKLLVSIVDRMEYWAVGHAKPIASAGLVLMILGGAIFYQVERGYSFLEYVPKHTESYQALRLLESELGGAAALQYPATATDGLISDPANWSVLGEIHDVLDAATGDRSVFSLVAVADWLSPENREQGMGAAVALLDELGEQAKSRLIATDDRGTVFTVFVRDEGAKPTRLLIEGIQNELNKIPDDQVTVSEPTGLLAVTSFQAIEVIDRLLLSLLLAIIGCIALIGVATGSLRYAVLSLVPNVLPILLTGAGLFVFGKYLQFSNAVALTVAFGIAVDNTIHFLNRYIRERQDNPRQAAIVGTMHHIGPVIITTTVTLSCGMSVTLLGNIPTAATFGLLCVSIFSIALVSNMIILPAMLMTISRKIFH